MREKADTSGTPSKAKSGRAFGNTVLCSGLLPEEAAVIIADKQLSPPPPPTHCLQQVNCSHMGKAHETGEHLWHVLTFLALDA